MNRRTTAAIIGLAMTTAIAAMAQTPGPVGDGAAPSPVERALSARAGVPLALHGHDRLSVSAAEPATLLGSVGDDHELGIGDVLSVALRGGRSADLRVTVDGAGLALVADLRPVPAAGRPLGEVRDAIRAEARARLLETEAFVSLAEVRQAVVTVVGEVARPGRKVVGPFSGPLDALGAAGGVLRGGSLRAVSLVRGGTAIPLDLYAVLDGTGDGTERRLRDGDRIVVPPAGPLAAVAGAVRRPGIFEFGAQPPSLADLVTMAGGPIEPRAMRWTRLTIGPDGRERVEEVADPAATVARAGDVLLVEPRDTGVEGRVGVAGHVLHPGPRSRVATPGLAALARSIAFPPDPYLPFAALETTDPATRRRTLVPVDLGAALAGTDDRPLVDDDRLIVLGVADVAFLSSRAVLAALAPRGRPAEAPGCAGLVALARNVSADADGLLATAPALIAARALPPVDAPCPVVFDRHPDLLPFVLSRSSFLRGGTDAPGLRPVVTTPGAAGPVPGAVIDVGPATVALDGAVRAPGRRPLAAAPTLRRLLDDDGLAPAAYPLLGFVERAAPGTPRRTIAFVPATIRVAGDDIALEAGDRVVILPAEGPGFDEADVADRWVTVAGAVARPGLLPVGGPVPLSALVAAAGGTTSGARIDRVLVTTAAGTRSVDLASAADDPVWPGTVVRIPATVPSVEPDGVRVEGAVHRPGALPLVSGAPAARYVTAAGGVTRRADREAAHLVLPDGRSRPLGDMGDRPVPPGSVIVVPTDPRIPDDLPVVRLLEAVLARIGTGRDAP